MTQPKAEGSNRIAKVIAHSGICSRREAEKLITEGKVTLNDQLVIKPGINVTPTDIIKVNGTIVRTQREIKLYKFYKPVGVITSKKDQRGRNTIYDILPKSFAHLIYIGRLDYNSEGLLLMTNNGDFSKKLTDPKNAIIRTYRVRVHGHVSEDKLNLLRKGITIKGIKYAPAEINIESQGNTNSWLTISIREGKNREIRNMLNHIDLQVNRLIRTSYGDIELGNLKIGDIKNISDQIEIFL